MWMHFNTLGTIGSENGKIMADEEYKNSCRITLEKCERYYAVTCGVYGSMIHTAFTDDAHCWKTYNAIKNDLQTFIDNIECMTEIEIEQFFDEFTSTY